MKAHGEKFTKNNMKTIKFESKQPILASIEFDDIVKNIKNNNIFINWKVQT